MARKIKCWSRTNKHNARYVVCSGSKGQKRRRSKRLRKKKQRGGEVKPFIGESWTSSPATWPGVSGNDGVSNHYPLANNVAPLPVSTTQEGGGLKCWSKKNKSNKRYVVCSGSKGQKRSSKRLRKKKQNGTRSKRLRKKKQKGGHKGGALAPQVLVNAGRSLLYNGQSLYNSALGVGGAHDPNPAVHPAMSKGMSLSMNTDRISDIYSSAEKTVGSI